MRLTHLLTATLAIAAFGCSGGGQNAPTAPSGAAEHVIPSDHPMVTHEFAGLSTGVGLASMWNVDLKLGANPTAELTPLRVNQTVGDTYGVDISSVLRGSTCGDCLQVESIDLNGPDLLDITFGLKHPFQSLAVRKDLHVFDVRGHLIAGSGLKTFTGITADLGAGPEPVSTNAGLVRNADGYSTFYDGVVEGFIGKSVPGNTRPYKFFWSDPVNGSFDPDAPSGWPQIENPTGHNVFPMGGTLSDPRASATYELSLTPGDTALSFLFMVDASYGVSAPNKPERLNPRYFLPLFNQAPPVLVNIVELGGGMLPGDSNSSVDIEVSVGDWQAGRTPPAGGFDPATARLTDVAFASDVSTVKIHVPGVLNVPVLVDRSTSIGGTGVPADPYIWDLTLHNDKRAPEGLYYGIVMAVDEVTTALSEGPTPLQRDTVTTDSYHDFNTYQLFTVAVTPPPNDPPTADLTATPNPAQTGADVNLCPGSGTGDTDGSIVKWEYDYDWDGVPANFVADVTRTTADADKCTTTVYTNGGITNLTFKPGMRVTDDLGANATDTLDVVVTPILNEPPTAELLTNKTKIFSGDTVTLTPGPGTGDPDGNIVTYDYDFDWDGVPANFDVDLSKIDNSPVDHVYTNVTTGPVDVHPALRVTDDGTPSASAIDDVTVTVKIVDPTPIWDFEDASESLDDLGFQLLGTNGLEKGPIPPCQASKNYSNDPPSSYNAPPVGSTWGLVSGIGNFEYPGNTTYRALEESGSTAAADEDNRYWSDAIYAIRSPIIPLPTTVNTLKLDLDHWFETDFDYEVDAVDIASGGGLAWDAMPNPGKVTNFDGATVWVREIVGGVPAATATRLDVEGPQATDKFWVTFNNAIGYKWEMLTLFQMTPSVESDHWIATNYAAGVDKGFGGMSYDTTVVDHRHAVPDDGVVGKWRVNPAEATWIDSTFDLTAWAGKEIVLEFRFASKKKTNDSCRTQPSGTTIYAPCIECMQNLEALTDTSVNHRRSRGWRIDRIEVREE
ncbi:MAG: hypothetical protein ABI743_02155 [bacterium]